MRPSRTIPSSARVSVTPSTPGALARLANVILEPRAAFRDVDAHPTWAIALAALVALRFGSLFAFYRPQTSTPKLVAGVLFQIITVTPQAVALAFVLWVVAKLWRAGLSWPSAFSVTVHVMFAYTLVTVAAASVAGAVLPSSVDVDLRSPPFMNLSVLVDREGHAVLHTVLAALDVRAAYAAALAWVGVSAVNGAGRARAAWVIATCFALCLVVAIVPAMLRG